MSAITQVLVGDLAVPRVETALEKPSLRAGHTVDFGFDASVGGFAKAKLDERQRAAAPPAGPQHKALQLVARRDHMAAIVAANQALRARKRVFRLTFGRKRARTAPLDERYRERPAQTEGTVARRRCRS